MNVDGRHFTLGTVLFNRPGNDIDIVAPQVVEDVFYFIPGNYAQVGTTNGGLSSLQISWSVRLLQANQLVPAAQSDNIIICLLVND